MVSEPWGQERLAHVRTVAVVLRLVIDRRGQLSHGEILSTAGQVPTRFSEWSALVPALLSWLESEIDG
jgi:hypothetical protein